MTYEMNFEMYVGAKEQRKEVLAVIKNALIANGYEEFANNFVADKRDGYLIKENTSCSFTADNFDEAISTIYKAIIRELPDVVFKGLSGYTWGTYEAGHCFEKKDNFLMLETFGYDGDGTCPECGEEVVDVDNFDPNKTYICPECGEEISASDLFDGFYNEEKTFEIVNGELIEK